MLQGIISGAGWFLLFLAVHVFWFHRVHVVDCSKLIVKILAVCFLGHLATILILDLSQLPADMIALRIGYGALVMTNLFIVYMPFYFTIATSLSIQTLISLEESEAKVLTLAELQQRFASRDTVERRLHIMVRNGYLASETPGRYYITAKGHWVSVCFARLKEVWRLGAGG